MKKILIVVLFFTCKSYGQTTANIGANYYPTQSTYTTYPVTIGFSDGSLFSRVDNTRVISTYDTTVLYEGDKSCIHLFATKRVYEGMYSGNISCAVAHGPAGCPDQWDNEKMICTVCLRHIQVKESRHTETIKNPYNEALERLEKLQKK